jgi:hypothetical protein
VLTGGFALVLLAATPTYHYPKLFFYPLAVWLAWRYMERPDVIRAAALGLTTAIAFLFRHDHGVYIGVLALVAFGLTRIGMPASRRLRAMFVESVSYTAAAAAILLPWLTVVQVNEGFREYVRSRSHLYEAWSASHSPYSALLELNPVRTLVGDRAVPPRSAAVTLTWNAHVDATRRAELEQHYQLRPMQDGPDEAGRWHYEVPNVYDATLWELRGEIENADSSEGFDWEQLERLRAPWLIPTRDAAQLWFLQLALLIPLLLLTGAGIAGVRAWRERGPMPLDALKMAAAAVFLIVIESSVLREASYIVTVIPLTAAVSAPFLVGRRTGSSGSAHRAAFRSAARWAVVAAVLMVTTLATFAYTRNTGIYSPLERARTVKPVFAELMTSPPLDAYLSSADARAADWETWNTGGVDKARLLMRYMHDCSRPGDRLLVTGSTPYHVNYYTDRSVAGGHLFWHHGYLSDPIRERGLLAMLEQQSVPFAFSTHDPVLEDLKRYPLIRQYMLEHYVEVDGTSGLLLIDARRQPTGRFGGLGLPCFG